MRRLRGNGGFTLSETLLAVLLLLMVSLVAAGGIPSARRAYTEITDSADAQVLLSTAAALLRDELSLASQAQAADAATLRYRSANTGLITTLSCSEDGELTLTEERPGQSGATSRPLARAGGPDRDLWVTWERVDCGKALFTIHGLAVKREDGTVLASLETYQIRPVMKTGE